MIRRETYIDPHGYIRKVFPWLIGTNVSVIVAGVIVWAVTR